MHDVADRLAGRCREGGEIEAVAGRKIGDVIHEVIAAGIAGDVLHGPHESVAAVTAGEQVIALAAADQIIAGTAAQGVVPEIAGDGVVEAGADDGSRCRRWHRCLRRR